MTRSNRTVVSIIAVVLAAAAVVVLVQGWRATPSSGAPGQEGWVSTAAGPLGPADRDLVVRVRLAGLWEMPVGQEAQERATQPRVREIAEFISNEHMELDQKSRDVARELGILLPNLPSEQQRGWMRDISAQTGANYDRTMVNLLRQAHGQVLPLLTSVRATTRNDTVRRFAEESAVYVQRHINYLESTGLVDYNALPEPQSPGLLSGSADWRDLIVPGLVLIACILAASLIGASLRGRSKGKAGKPTLPPMVTTAAPRVATAAALIALPEAVSTSRSGTSTSSGAHPVISPGTPPGGIPDVPTAGRGIPRSRVSDSGRHAVRR